ncbi:MAG: FAD-dependent oxidoreductase [Chitinophagales bacterium]|nr:FAD-dependent oxidoreductase [Chitinophagales bacterium]
MKNYNVIIVGAGAAGLMAAHILKRARKKVIVVEARNRIGGRIFTQHSKKNNLFFELGAEFIHGDLPVTFSLLKEAGINSLPTGGKSYNVERGNVLNENSFQDFEIVMQKLLELKSDVSIQSFLEKYFPDEKFYALRKSITGFVEGYDAADTSKASAFALRDEWLNDDSNHNYKIEGGYISLINYLAGKTDISLNCAVKEIHWKNKSVEAISDNKIFHAEKIIVTVPVKILQLEKPHKNAIEFLPLIHEKIDAAKKIGVGSAIKILLLFDEKFWESSADLKIKSLQLSEMNFLFSGELIPTWWTQYPNKIPLLTGWLAGPKAEKYKDVSDDEILNIAIDSLANIFQIERSLLRKKLIHSIVSNWMAEEFSQSAYAYSTVHSFDARKILNEPIVNTIYFAGEALYEGPAMGTVEAALASGKAAAKKILSLS